MRSSGIVEAPSAKARRGAATRADIVAASMELFARRGFHNTSVADIAEGAGITKGAIYWHFESKEALFGAILERIQIEWREQVHRNVTEAKGPLQKMETLFDNYAVLLAKVPFLCSFLYRVRLEADDAHAKRTLRIFDDTARFIAGIVREGQRDGVFREDRDAKLAAYSVLSSLTGAYMQCHTNPGLRLGALLEEIKTATLARLRR